MGVLEAAGILKDGKISDSMVDRFFVDVKKLLGTGNQALDFWIVPIPPAFPPDPLIGVLNPLGVPLPPYEDRNLFPIYHKIFIDAMLEGTAKALDTDGGTPLAPVMDPCALALKLGIPLPDLSFDAALGLFPLPTPDIFIDLLEIDAELALELPGILVELAVPGKLPFPPLPPIPDLSAFIILPTVPGLEIPFPQIPTIPLPAFPPLELNIDVPGIDFNIPSIIPLLTCILTVAIPTAFLKLVEKAPELPGKLAEGPLGVVAFVAEVVVISVLACIGSLVIGSLLTFVAGLVIYIKYVIIFLVLALIAQILGVGCLTTGFADFLLSS